MDVSKKVRRHSNNNGRQQIKADGTYKDLKRLAKKLGVKFGKEAVMVEAKCANCGVLLDTDENPEDAMGEVWLCSNCAADED